MKHVGARWSNGTKQVSLFQQSAGGIMNITIDRTKCDGYAKCVQAAPKVFRLDAKMIAEVIDPKAETDEKILLTAKICPTKAIVLEEEETGKRIFPSE
jgi:ferredoxin